MEDENNVCTSTSLVPVENVENVEKETTTALSLPFDAKFQASLSQIVSANLYGMDMSSRLQRSVMNMNVALEDLGKVASTNYMEVKNCQNEMLSSFEKTQVMIQTNCERMKRMDQEISGLTLSVIQEQKVDIKTTWTTFNKSPGAPVGAPYGAPLGAPFGAPFGIPVLAPPSYTMARQRRSNKAGDSDIMSKMEILLVMKLRLGERTSHNYTSGVPVNCRETQSWCYVLFAGSLLFWFQKLVDGTIKYQRYHQDRNVPLMQKISIQANKIYEFLDYLEECNLPTVIPFDEKIAEKCKCISPFFIQSSGKPGCREDAILENRKRALEKNFAFISPTVLENLLKKHPKVRYMGDVALLDVQKRMNNKQGRKLPLEVIYNIDHPPTMDKKQNGLIKGLKSRPKDAQLQNFFTCSEDLEYSSWIPYPTSQKFFQSSDNFLAWNLLFDSPLGKEMTRHAPINVKEIFGKEHLSWNWTLETDRSSRTIEPFKTVLTKILRNLYPITPVYFQAGGNKTNKVCKPPQKKRKNC
jgi:hypothetical protein